MTRERDGSTSFVTRGGIRVERTLERVDGVPELEAMIERLDGERGVLLASSYEYPGRYTRWDIGFCDPPLSLTARGRNFTVAASNARGRVLIPAIAAALKSEPATEPVVAIPMARPAWPERARAWPSIVAAALAAVPGMLSRIPVRLPP